MTKKIFFQLVFFNFLFIGKVFAAESGGMPQLNPEFWVSQIFWLIITFGILYVVLSKLILPKISSNLESRKLQISDNIEAADKQREEITFLRNEYEKAKVLIKETEAEKVLYKEMLEQYQHRESNASALQHVTSNQIDQLDAILQQHKDELAAKQDLINKTVREYSTVMSNYESKTEYCLAQPSGCSSNDVKFSDWSEIRF